MVVSAVAASNLRAGALIFVVSLAAAPIAIVSWYLFPVCPYLRHVLQLIGLSYYSKTLVFACSPVISMNFCGSFSLKVSRSGVEVMFLIFTHVAFSRLGGCTRSLVPC